MVTFNFEFGGDFENIGFFLHEITPMMGSIDTAFFVRL